MNREFTAEKKSRDGHFRRKKVGLKKTKEALKIGEAWISREGIKKLMKYSDM